MSGSSQAIYIGLSLALAALTLLQAFPAHPTSWQGWLALLLRCDVAGDYIRLSRMMPRRRRSAHTRSSAAFFLLQPQRIGLAARIDLVSNQPNTIDTIETTFVTTAKSMSDRFNRPMSADQINQTLEMLQRGAEKHGASPDVGDLLYKARPVIRLLWRECNLHENLEETAAQTLNDVEKRLADCLEQKALAEAAKALAEVNRLKALIDNPPANFKTWDDSQS